jgi:hypothetical protein
MLNMPSKRDFDIRDFSLIGTGFDRTKLNFSSVIGTFTKNSRYLTKKFLLLMFLCMFQFNELSFYNLIFSHGIRKSENTKFLMISLQSPSYRGPYYRALTALALKKRLNLVITKNNSGF